MKRTVHPLLKSKPYGLGALKVKGRIAGLLLVPFMLLNASFVFAQKETNIWCFGVNVMLDFNSGSPVFVPGSAMNQYEGCSSIADGNGDLLFYTDGVSVWNKNHQLMPNGTGLFGDNSTAQSALIIKQPGNPNIYYVFTAPAQGGPAGFNYSTVDLTMQAGLGDVVQKNVNLLAFCDERITGARHANGIDIWVMATSSSGDSIHSFLLTSVGLNSTPVTSYNGLSHTGFYDQIGTMKTSPGGDYLGVAINSEPDGHFELYSFNNANGTATLIVDMSSPAYMYAYGIEFSPNGKIMYGSEYGAGYHIYQFDLLAGSPAAIAASALLIDSTSTYCATMQLASNGKIYIAKWFGTSLASIENPDQLGLGCNFVETAISFPNECDGGLPNFFPGLFQLEPQALFTAPHHVCPGTCTNFTNLSSYATSYQWYFPGGTPSTSTDVNPTGICYFTPGNYGVSLVATNGAGSDSISLPNYITVYPFAPSQNIIQVGDSLISNTGFTTYQWFYDGDTIPGATDYYYIATQSGDYSLLNTDAYGCFVETVVLNVIADVSEASAVMGWMVFPNPANDVLEIKMPSAVQVHNCSLAIYNTLGESVLFYENCPEARLLDISGLSPGFYSVELNAGNQKFWNKFVKQ